LLDAALLALNDKYHSLSHGQKIAQVVLIPKDTRGTADGAEKVAKEAIAEGAELIIGPLFSHSVRSVHSVASEHGVNVITFSNNRAVAQRGVFLFGFMPEQQATRIGTYAVQSGFNRIAVFAPNTPYGTNMTRAFSETVDANNGIMQSKVFYNPEDTNLRPAVEQLLGTRSFRTVLNFDTIFIPEGGEVLKKVMVTLGAKGIRARRVKVLGTGLWDDNTGDTLLLLPGGWFASSPAAQYKAFERRFQNVYNYMPQRLTSLSYDAVALATTLALEPAGADFSYETLTNPAGFSGPANGIFRFREDSICERGLAVLEIGEEGYDIIDPAPEYFR
jgi:ABC-type branched-subunit amino acid transport system substrate-binding protein